MVDRGGGGGMSTPLHHPPCGLWIPKKMPMSCKQGGLLAQFIDTLNIFNGLNFFGGLQNVVHLRQVKSKVYLILLNQAKKKSRLDRPRSAKFAIFAGWGPTTRGWGRCLTAGFKKKKKKTTLPLVQRPEKRSPMIRGLAVGLKNGGNKCPKCDQRCALVRVQISQKCADCGDARVVKRNWVGASRQFQPENLKE